MNGLIRFSLRNPRAITVLMLTIVAAGVSSLSMIPADILPVYKAPAIQCLTFYGGMSATNVEKDITTRMERNIGQSPGMKRQQSRSIIGASVIYNYYTDDTDPAGALTAANSLATNAIPNLPPGTLPPVILPFDPTGTTPVALVALNSKTQNESTLYDVARYTVRNYIMASPGANAPVVYGGKIRTILAYLDPDKLQSRGLSPVDAMAALDRSNVFLPAGDAKLGTLDYALDSNSLYDIVDRMGDVPVKTDPNGGVVFLKDVAKPMDTSLIQTCVVRVDGRRQVYIPIYRQQGSSTLEVVNGLRKNLPDMEAKLTVPDIHLEMVMDQSVYVTSSIQSLAQEGILGAFLCSMVILLFLGEWRMTLIAVMTIPVAVMGSIACLFGLGQTINVMTLAGLALAVGPMVDSAIICLENTHRHLGLGASPREAAYLGASEVALPEMVASLCTLLVLLPLALMPGLGAFLFRPMFFAVAFTMCIAYVLSRTFVPARCAAWLKGHHSVAHVGPAVPDGSASERPAQPDLHYPGLIARVFAKWEGVIERAIGVYTRVLDRALRVRYLVIAAAFTALAVVLVVFGPNLRREFFPEVDAGSFTIFARAPTGTRIERTEEMIGRVEKVVKDKIGPDLQIVISQLGLTPDWSASYTPNAGPMDAVVMVQLNGVRSHSAQEYVQILRETFLGDPSFNDLEFAFDAGGMITAAMNEGSSTPINVKIEANDMASARGVAEKILREVRGINGVVDARIIQRLDYPQYTVEVDRAKAADLGLTQTDVMKNMIAAFNSSVQFNKNNFWIDPKSHNQYYVGVQYPEADINSLDVLLNIPINSPVQNRAVPLSNMATIKRVTVPAEVVHTNLSPTMDLTMGVHGRDLGHVASDIQKVVAKFGVPREDGNGWTPFDPNKEGQVPMTGAKLTLSGEYQKMQDTFRFQGMGMIAAVTLIYFLMVALFRSYVTPLAVLSAVPIGVTGVVLMLFFTGTALNVQSLLGVIFMVGIVVSNTVLLTDFAVNLQKAEKLTSLEAIKRAAGIRVRPVCMTALATFFALIPMSLGIERGSEANVPLGRAVLGGLLAGLVTTLIVVPCLYSLLVKDDLTDPNDGPILPSDAT